MRIDIAPRASGKTARLIAGMALDPEHSICISHSAKAAHETYLFARKLYPEITWREDQFIAISSTSLRYSRSRPEWLHKYIDNADMCLESLFGTLRTITMREPEGTFYPEVDDRLRPREPKITMPVTDNELSREILRRELRDAGYL